MSKQGGILWDHYRIAQKLRRKWRLPKRTEQIMALKDEGYHIKPIDSFQFRINGRLDILPLHNQFHDIKTRQRGGYRDVSQFVREYFKQCKR